MNTLGRGSLDDVTGFRPLVSDKIILMFSLYKLM